MGEFKFKDKQQTNKLNYNVYKLVSKYCIVLNKNIKLCI